MTNLVKLAQIEAAYLQHNRQIGTSDDKTVAEYHPVIIAPELRHVPVHTDEAGNRFNAIGERIIFGSRQEIIDAFMSQQKRALEASKEKAKAKKLDKVIKTIGDHKTHNLADLQMMAK